MANVDNARGLRPLRYLSGAPYSGAVTTYYVPASNTGAIYLGGLVKLSGDADADGVPGVSGVVSSGDAVVGVMVGMANPTRDSKTYRPASTEAYVLVADDPNLVFAVQEDGVGGALDASSSGMVADIVTPLAGDTTTGQSGLEIDSSTATAGGDGTEDLLLLGLERDVNNTFGVNADWLVRLNNHAFVDGNTGA